MAGHRRGMGQAWPCLRGAAALPPPPGAAHPSSPLLQRLRPWGAAAPEPPALAIAGQRGGSEAAASGAGGWGRPAPRRWHPLAGPKRWGWETLQRCLGGGGTRSSSRDSLLPAASKYPCPSSPPLPGLLAWQGWCSCWRRLTGRAGTNGQAEQPSAPSWLPSAPCSPRASPAPAARRRWGPVRPSSSRWGCLSPAGCVPPRGSQTGPVPAPLRAPHLPRSGPRRAELLAAVRKQRAERGRGARLPGPQRSRPASPERGACPRAGPPPHWPAPGRGRLAVPAAWPRPAALPLCPRSLALLHPHGQHRRPRRFWAPKPRAGRALPSFPAPANGSASPRLSSRHPSQPGPRADAVARLAQLRRHSQAATKSQRPRQTRSGRRAATRD